MIVHSFDRFGETGEFDPETGALRAGAGAGADANPAGARGHYGVLAGTPVVLYRDPAAGLRLRVGSTVVPVDDTVSVTHEHHDGRTTVEVTDRTSGTVAARLDYVLPEPVVAPEDDPTPFAEAEDFDFGLFITNVANNERRRSVIYQQ